MLRRVYDWVLEKAARPSAVGWLAFLSFIESSFCPIYPHLLLVPMVLARRSQWLFLSGVTAVSSVAGGVFGYAIGYFLMQGIGQRLIDFYGLQSAFEGFRDLTDEWGAWAVFIAGVTPIPYKAATLSAGAMHLDLFAFIMASLASRTIHFTVLGGLLYIFGPSIRSFAEKWLGLIFLAIVVVVGVVFALLS